MYLQHFFYFKCYSGDAQNILEINHFLMMSFMKEKRAGVFRRMTLTNILNIFFYDCAGSIRRADEPTKIAPT